MPSVRFVTNEDVYGATEAVPRNAGLDAISTPQAGRLGESDESQLEWATGEGSVLVTFNVAHFANLHAEWMRQSRHLAGIIVSQQRPIGDLLRSLLNLAETLDADAMQDRLEYMSDW